MNTNEIHNYTISYNNEKRKKRNSHLALLNYYWDNRNKTPGGDTDSAKAIDNTIHVIKTPTALSFGLFCMSNESNPGSGLVIPVV